MPSSVNGPSTDRSGKCSRAYAIRAVATPRRRVAVIQDSEANQIAIVMPFIAAPAVRDQIVPHSPDDALSNGALHADSDIGISTLFWIERGGDGKPGGGIKRRGFPTWF